MGMVADKFRSKYSSDNIKRYYSKLGAIVEFLLTEIADALKEIPVKYKVLLITSISLNNKLSPYVLNIRKQSTWYL